MLSVSNAERMAQFASEPHAINRAVSRTGTPAAAAGHAAVEFALVTTRQAFDALDGEWNALFERAGRPDQIFQTFNWCWHWCNHFLADQPSRGRSTSLAVLTGRRGGRLVMVWPLVLERIGLIRQLRWLGEPVSQYGDVLIEETPDRLGLLLSAWQHIVISLAPSLAHLRKVRDDAVVAPLLARVGARQLARDEAPYLDLASAPDSPTYELRYSKSAIRNRRRLMRRLEERGAVAVDRPAQGDAAARLAGMAIDMKRAWLKHRGIRSQALADARTRHFFRDVAGLAVHPVGCQVSAITSGGQPAALQISFACKGMLAIHVLVYALTFEKAGVGVLHIEEAIRQAFRDRVQRIDLLAPRDPYKTEWADGAVGVGDYAVPLTMTGRAYTRGYIELLRPRLAALLGARSGGRTRHPGQAARGKSDPA